MSKLLWYLIIKSLDQTKKEDVELFDTLNKVSINSKLACLKISKEVYHNYLFHINKQMFIWEQSYGWDGWGSYKGQWRITEWEPSQQDIDSCENESFIFRGTVNDVLEYKS